MAKCVCCGKSSFLWKIDNETGLCNKCAQDKKETLGKYINKPAQCCRVKDVSEKLFSTLRGEKNTKATTIQSPSRKRKKLYNENVEKATNVIQQTPDELFDQFDDFARLEAESAAIDQAEKVGKPRKSAFKPDRPFILDENGKIIEDVVEDISADVPVIKADKKSNVSIDDLKIQPEAYELPDDDEPPFDIPDQSKKQKTTVEAGITEKKSFPKLKWVVEPDTSWEDTSLVYNYLPIDLLAQGEAEDIYVHGQRDMQKAKLLEDTLQSFGISAKLTGIAHGSAVTRFELQPAPGVKVSSITSLSDIIELNLEAKPVRIEAPIPGKAAVGVEIPNDKVEMVYLRDVLESSEARKQLSRIAVGLGKDNSGRYIMADIATMPHMLIAGQTGSGKSVCINSIIASILYRATPDEVKLMMIDPKMVELSIYNGIPHLVCPVINDPRKASSALDWTVSEITRRYKVLAAAGVKNIKEYNKRMNDNPMFQMVIIIDELADLMMVAPGEIEDSICRIAQLGRACGIHLVVATQRLSTNVITGNIKASIPTHIAFSVNTQEDSHLIIDCSDAEKLLGSGDMLYVFNGMKAIRIQGTWVSDDEIHAIVEYIKQSREVVYKREMMAHKEKTVCKCTKIEKQKVISLLKLAKTDAVLANTTTRFAWFMELFNDVLVCLKQGAEIERAFPNFCLKGSLQKDYDRLLGEKQEHMRDAIKREYCDIINKAEVEYHNNRKMVIDCCKRFMYDIKQYKDEIDNETAIFADDIMRKLSLQFDITTERFAEIPTSSEDDFDSMEGHEFERWCANLLLANGFDSASVTQGSGDQGVDIIAKKEDIRYAVQCKCYTADLGNTPIQEVVAGKSFYKCQIGVVMTNRFFTKSAKELANATGTLLWDRNKILEMRNRSREFIKPSDNSTDSDNGKENEIGKNTTLHSNENGKTESDSNSKQVKSNNDYENDCRLYEDENAVFGKAVNQINTTKPNYQSVFCKDEKNIENLAAEILAEKKEYSNLRWVMEQNTMKGDPFTYNYPPIDLLHKGEAEDSLLRGQRDMRVAMLLEDTLLSFGISAKLTDIVHGPFVTRFELQPAFGVKVSSIKSLSEDIALNLGAMSVHIEAPIPGKAAVGVEIPNDKVEMVRLRDVLESSEARKHPSRIAVGLGKDNSGRYIVADIAKMPHVLIAGQTGSGKSVCINAIITSILFRASPEEVKLILIDPKVVELSIYNDIPHLVCPVVTDPKKAASALDWAVAEMTRRYKLFAERGVRDIKGYNKALKDGEPMMPQMVIIIDELADLMMVSPGEVEDSICRLAQRAHVCGMHLVIATQRPSKSIITDIMKTYIPTRITFSVASQADSRTMIDHGGAEKLLGNGDMLFLPNGMKSMRVQGAWVSDDEVHAIVEYIKQSSKTNYDQDMLEHMDKAVRTDAEKEEIEFEYDPKFPEAVDIAIDFGQVSIPMLQRKMRIGYARAGRIIDEMSRRGIVSEADGSKPREVLITREQAKEMFEE